MEIETLFIESTNEVCGEMRGTGKEDRRDRMKRNGTVLLWLGSLLCGSSGVASDKIPGTIYRGR